MASVFEFSVCSLLDCLLVLGKFSNCFVQYKAAGVRKNVRRYSTVQYSTVLYSTLQYSTVQNSKAQRSYGITDLFIIVT